MQRTSEPPPPRARRRRDRRGRGLRGPLAPATSPLTASRGDRFGDLVLAAVDRLEPRWGPRLPALDVEVRDVPPGGAGPVGERGAREDDVPLAAHRRATRESPPVIVVYRRPVELRTADRPARIDLVRDLVVEQLAEILGVDPGELDPAYDLGG